MINSYSQGFISIIVAIVVTIMAFLGIQVLKVGQLQLKMTTNLHEQIKLAHFALDYLTKVENHLSSANILGCYSNDVNNTHLTYRIQILPITVCTEYNFFKSQSFFYKITLTALIRSGLTLTLQSTYLTPTFAPCLTQQPARKPGRSSLVVVNSGSVYCHENS